MLWFGLRSWSRFGLRGRGGLWFWSGRWLGLWSGLWLWFYDYNWFRFLYLDVLSFRLWIQIGLDVDREEFNRSVRGA